MKKLSLGLLAFLLCFSSHADLLIYKLRYTISRTGGGSFRSIATTGWIILDNDLPEMAIVKAEAKYKIINTEFPMIEGANTRGVRFKYISACRIMPGELSGNMTLRGVDVEKNPESAPTTFSIGGLDWWLNENDVQFLDEYKGTAVLDKAKTARAKLIGQTLDDAVEEAETFFTNKNFSVSDQF